MARIAMIAGYGRSLVTFRGDLIKELIARGHEVVTIAPDADCAADVRNLGCQYNVAKWNRSGLNPLSDIASLRELIAIIQRNKPDILFVYSAKALIYGSIAANLVGVDKKYTLISGLGYAFGESKRQRAVGVIVRLLYKHALRTHNTVFFQNPDDLKVFETLHLLPVRAARVLVNGSGVDLDKFKFENARTSPLSFLLMARLIWDKGIGQLVEAGRLLKREHPEIRIVVLGGHDNNPNAIKPELIKEWEKEGVIEYLGEAKDVRPFLAEASVYVLPSFYPEGIPRSILEAMAVGRPIITTDMPGCRETVENGINGYLVPPKDSAALAAAMEKFILHPELVASMGARSREIAVEKYDVRKVNQSMLQAMGL